MQAQKTSPVPTKKPAPVERLYDFPDAIRELINGARIRRQAWLNADFCILRDGFLEIYREENQKFHQWIVSDGDLQSTDWIITPVN